MDESLAAAPLPTPAATDTGWRSIDPPQLPQSCEAVEYHPDSGTYCCSFDSSESVALTVVSTVAAAAETDPLDLPPLHHAVDTDAFASLPRAPIDGPSNTSPNAIFSFADHLVNVHSTGVVSVQQSVNADTAAE